MNYVTLNEAKKHLLVDSSFTEDDNYIMSLIQVSEDSVQQHLNFSLSDLEDEGGNLPPSLKHAILLMVGNLYMNREPVTFGSVAQIPYTLEYLINLYRNFSVK